MICLLEERNTLRWLKYQTGKVTESDVPAIVGTPHTQRWEDVVERLFLDHERAAQDPYELEKKLSWKIRFVPEVREAIKRFSSLTHRVQGAGARIFPGLYCHDEHTWLVASPHGLTEDRVIHVAPHFYRKQWEIARRNPAPPELFARLQVVMYVMGMDRCELIHCWNPEGALWMDSWDARTIEFDPKYIEGTFMPAVVALWQNVRKLREETYA